MQAVPVELPGTHVGLTPYMGGVILHLCSFILKTGDKYACY